MKKSATLTLAIASAVLSLTFSSASMADDLFKSGGKLLLTGGVSQVEGAAGGGLTPWAVIGGYGTKDEIKGNLHTTYIKTNDFRLNSYGVTVGFYDTVELSVAEQSFDVGRLRNNVDAALPNAIGRDKLDQTIVGAKVKLLGDAVLDADTLMPQISVGMQYKINHDKSFVKSSVIGAKSAEGVDFYVSATKLFLDQNFLFNTTLRMTRANQFGLLGFGGAGGNNYEPQLELSGAYLLSKNLVVGAEYRMKPNNLKSPANDALFGGANTVNLKEHDAFDVFVAYAPTKNVSLTAAYVNLGNIATVDLVGADYGHQDGLYLSAQVGF